MTGIVLDASALIAMLNAEPGAGKVAEAIASTRMCAVNYAEVVSHYAHLGMPPATIDAMLDPLPIEIVPADQALSRIAGRLRALTAEAGLLLGDGLASWTCDRQWSLVAEAIGVDVVQIR